MILSMKYYMRCIITVEPWRDSGCVLCFSVVLEISITNQEQIRDANG